MSQPKTVEITTGNRVSGTEVAAAATDCGDPQSSDDGLGSASLKISSRIPGADDTGDKLLSGVSEPFEPTVSDPIADNTDFGEWFSCSESDIFGDRDLVAAIDISLLGERTSLRG